MSADVEIELVANDLASDSIDRVVGRIGDLEETSDSAGMSMSRTFATAGRTAASSIIAFDRYSIAANAVENANTRVALAQDRLNTAIERDGAGSERARRAKQDLEIATRSLEIAQQRLEVRMLMGGLIVFPRMVEGVSKLATQFRLLTSAQNVDTLATQANTAAKLANIAVTTLGLGLALALPALMIAQMATASPAVGGGGGGAGPINMNFYGDNQFTGVTSTQDFARASAESALQQRRTSAP